MHKSWCKGSLFRYGYVDGQRDSVELMVLNLDIIEGTRAVVGTARPLGNTPRFAGG